MKPTRSQRAWTPWLAPPQGIRPGAVAAIVSVIIAALLAVWPRPAKAEDMLVATNGKDAVTLFDRPCTHAGTLIVMIAQRIPASLREQFRAARATVGGQDFYGCWIVDGNSAHLIYEDGDHGLIPISDFVPPGRTAPKPDA